MVSETAVRCEDRCVSPSLSGLLKLPPGERAKLAMNLWDSLSADELEAELELSAAQAAELDLRWQEHLESPDLAVRWEEVRRKLLDRE